MLSINHKRFEELPEDITHLKIEDDKWSGLIELYPEDIKKLNRFPYLKYLELNCVFMGGCLPRTLEELSLDSPGCPCDGNKIIIPQQYPNSKVKQILEELPLLRRLSIIDGLDSFSAIPPLQHLEYLSVECMWPLKVESFPDLPALKELRLGISIGIEDIEQLPSLPKLEHLFIDELCPANEGQVLDVGLFYIKYPMLKTFVTYGDYEDAALYHYLCRQKQVTVSIDGERYLIDKGIKQYTGKKERIVHLYEYLRNGSYKIAEGVYVELGKSKAHFIFMTETQELLLALEIRDYRTCGLRDMAGEPDSWGWAAVALETDLEEYLEGDGILYFSKDKLWELNKHL